MREERVWMLPSCSATLADTLQRLEESWLCDLTIPSPSLGHSLYKNAGVGWNELFQFWLPWVLVSETLPAEVLVHLRVFPWPDDTRGHRLWGRPKQLVAASTPHQRVRKCCVHTCACVSV